jgi:hypothetical protein
MAELLFSLDPGAKKLGVAFFRNKTLEAARTIDAADETKAVEAALRFFVLQGEKALAPGLIPPGCTFVCERMHKRPGRSKYDEDLDRVERTRHAIRDAIPQRKWTRTYNPTQWKGNTPKNVHHRRCRAVLSIDEQKIWDRLGHDARDAVGIGLFHLNRIKRGGIRA